ncbi:hypothetical protein [uncultured Duncaniella sp.]|mgnify:FL=1|uniref:hypothetical protein n=1 Tax=uncultured Duncaniella sp. TaxID=2768039 RepID=UPI0025D637F3|nr:hypothetical protein [uncultured Duncaniella sp.]
MSKKTKSNNPSVPAASQGRETLSTVLVTVGLLAIMVAAVLPLLRVAQDWARYLYAAGAVILLVGRFVAPAVKNAPVRLRRLLHIEIWTAIIFMVGAVFLFLPSAGAKDWIAFTLAGGFLTLYTSIMIPRQKLD